MARIIWIYIDIPCRNFPLPFEEWHKSLWKSFRRIQNTHNEDFPLLLTSEVFSVLGPSGFDQRNIRVFYSRDPAKFNFPNELSLLVITKNKTFQTLQEYLFLCLFNQLLSLRTPEINWRRAWEGKNCENSFKQKFVREWKT